MSEHGAWRLSGLVADRCSDTVRRPACWPGAAVRRPVCRAAAWLELAGGLGVSGAGGSAVLSLAPPRLRDKARVLAVVSAAVAAAVGAIGVGLALWWPVTLPALAVWTAVMVPAVLVSWRCRAGDRRLREARPVGGWYVHNFAGDPRRPGAGRSLLGDVCAEADRQGRVLYLDTTVDRLVEYYRQLDFEVAASVPMAARGLSWTAFRMVRQPAGT